MIVVGVDACEPGWLAVALGEQGVVRILVRRSFVEILKIFRYAQVVAVDIPIGPPDRHPRPADLAAKKFVGGRRQSSVFLTPPRAVLEAETRADARTACLKLDWSWSEQGYALRWRILEVEAVLEDRVIEVHPEVSFRELGGQILADSKKTAAGLAAREQLLRTTGIRFTPPLTHDLLDAGVAAWSAQRYAVGRAFALPYGGLGRGVIWR